MLCSNPLVLNHSFKDKGLKQSSMTNVTYSFSLQWSSYYKILVILLEHFLSPPYKKWSFKNKIQVISCCLELRKTTLKIGSWKLPKGSWNFSKRVLRVWEDLATLVLIMDEYLAKSSTIVILAAISASRPRRETFHIPN